MLKTKSLKGVTKFYPLIYSRHPTHSILRLKARTLPLLPFKSLIRLGSTTEKEDTVSKGGNRIECNTVAAIRNSSNKLKMKECFTKDSVKTAVWTVGTSSDEIISNLINRVDQKEDESLLPIVAKHIYGSRGNGNTLIHTREELTNWLRGKTLSNYIFEKFYNYNKEYRLHVTEEGCFYTCRKMLRKDAPEDAKWFRNDKNCNWIIEENELFEKPSNWNQVVSESVKALKAVGLDIGAVDLRIQSNTTSNGKLREEPNFIVVEINSAPSFAKITSEKYIVEIPKVLRRKYETKNKF